MFWVSTGYLREEPWSGTNFMYDETTIFVKTVDLEPIFRMIFSLNQLRLWEITIWNRFFLSVWMNCLRDKSGSGIDFSEFFESEPVIYVKNLDLETILCNRLFVWFSLWISYVCEKSRSGTNFSISISIWISYFRYESRSGIHFSDISES